MRIAQVAPLFESVPPKLYGGTERVVSFLTEDLVRLGHQVTLFASADSRTSATLIAMCPEALRLRGLCVDHVAMHLTMLERVVARAHEFDVIHFHTSQLHYPVMRRLPYVRHVTTLHGRLDMEELLPLYDEFSDVPVVSISDAQRNPLPDAGWVATVYHGLPPGLFRLYPTSGTYLAFLGRISPEKRVDRAIAIAMASGLPLKIAAKVDRADQDYFERIIAPLLANPIVEFIGEISERTRTLFSARRKPCSSRLTGPSRSGWS